MFGRKTIFIPGIPDVKMRPRFQRRSGHSYDPNAEAKEASIQRARSAGDHRTYQGALAVKYEFVFPRPKSHFGTGKNAGKLKPSAPTFCTNPKDLDNMEKFYADSFEGIHYVNDKQIVEHVSSIKRYARESEQPFVKIEILPLEDIDKQETIESTGTGDPPVSG